MPIPRSIGHLNKYGLNQVTKLIFPWLPGFGVIVHRGRRTGRRYRTPVNVFKKPDGYVIALTYGPEADWVKNVMATGKCELERLGRVIQLVSPRLYHDRRRPHIRFPERLILPLLGVADFLSLETASPASSTPPISRG